MGLGTPSWETLEEKRLFRNVARQKLEWGWICSSHWFVQIYYHVRSTNSFFSAFLKLRQVFKSGPSKICGRQPLKNLKGYGLLKHTQPTNWVCLTILWGWHLKSWYQKSNLKTTAYLNTDWSYFFCNLTLIIPSFKSSIISPSVKDNSSASWASYGYNVLTCGSFGFGAGRGFVDPGLGGGGALRRPADDLRLFL